MLSFARYVNTATQRSDATNYTATSIQGWMPTARKVSPLVTAANSGTPAVSQWTLLAPGVWTIVANVQFSAASSLYICRGGFATANIMAGSGSVVNPNVTIVREFNANDVIMLRWTTPVGTMVQGSDDVNFVSFAYHGPI